MKKLFAGLMALSVLATSVPAQEMNHEEHALDAIVLGDLELSGAFARATLPGAPVGGGFLTITNTGDEADRLIAAESTFAPDVQIHEMAVVDDIMRMRELEEGIEIPADESVTLSPGGLHLMFMQISEPFVEGQTVPVTLTFETAGTIEIELSVQSFGAAGMEDHAAHDMGEHERH